MRRGVLKSGVCVILLLLANTLTFGQAITASLQGRVADTSGAVLPKATISVTNTETGFSRTTTSDDGGQYKLASLPVPRRRVTHRLPPMPRIASFSFA